MVSMRDYQLAGAGIALLVIGAFGPWAKVLSTSVNGLDGDGVLTLGLAVVAAVFVGLAYTKRAAPNKIALGVCGALALLISIIDIADVSGDISVGWGLWLTLIGSLVLIAAAVMAHMRKS
jgi:hypothetical protein